jgi:DNA polymerase III sliding clamp (beta) subunit (PCNA family)
MKGQFTADEVKQVIQLLSPSLGDPDSLEIFTKICFDGDVVYSYNDDVATLYEWEHGLGDFGVEGRTFLSLLSQLQGSEIQFKNDGKHLHMKRGNSEVKVAVADSDGFIFKRPELGVPYKMRLKEEGVLSLGEVLTSTAKSATNPVYLGVTLAVKEKDKTLRAYSTDGVTMMHAEVGEMLDPPKKAISMVIPKLAVQQIVNAMGVVDSTKVSVQANEDFFVAKVGIATVIAKLIKEDPPNYERPLRGDTLATLTNWREAPGFKNALELAATVCDVNGCEITILSKRQVRISAKSNLGSMSDVVEVKCSAEELPYSFKVNPNLLLEAWQLSVPDEIRLTENCALVGSNAMLYAVSFMKGKE